MKDEEPDPDELSECEDDNAEYDLDGQDEEYDAIDYNMGDNVTPPAPPAPDGPTGATQRIMVQTARKSTGGAAPRKNSHRYVNTRIRKPHRFKAGTVPLQDIEKKQETTVFAIKKSQFQDLVKQITQELNIEPDVTYQPVALEALQEASEALLAGIFEEAVCAAKFDKRATVTPRDMQLATRMRVKALYRINYVNIGAIEEADLSVKNPC